PNPSAGANYLGGVTGISPNDVWAVGEYGGASRGQTLTLHWDGTQWTHIPSPSPGSSDSGFGGVAAISSNDVWAVGYQVNGGWLTLTEHWDGTQWSVLPSPNPRPVENYLIGVSAVSTNDMWAVGYYSSASNGYQTLTEHWDGTQWSVVPSPNV